MNENKFYLDGDDLVSIEYMRQIEERAAGKDYEELIARLPYSKENARHYPELMQALQIGDRELRRLIRAARLDGIPVCGGDEGMWIADCIASWDRYLRRESHKTKEQLELMHALRITDSRIKSGKGIGVTRSELKSRIHADQLSIKEVG